METFFLLLFLFCINVSISKLVYKVVGVPDQNFTANQFLISREKGSDFDKNTSPGIFIDYIDGNKTYMYVTCWVRNETFYIGLKVIYRIHQIQQYFWF